MTWQKILYFVGIAVAILTAWAGSSFGFSAGAVAAFEFAAAALTAFASAVTEGISGPSHKVAWASVALGVLGVFAAGSDVVGPDVARFAGLALTTIAAATAIGHPAPSNPATSS